MDRINARVCFKKRYSQNDELLRQQSIENMTYVQLTSNTYFMYFLDINECETGPCIFLFNCEDRINEYQCNLIEWKLALIILTFVMLSLLVICAFAYIFKRKTYKDIDHSW